MSVTLPIVLTVGGVTLGGQYLKHQQDVAQPFTPGRVLFGTVALGLFLAAVETGSEEIARGVGALVITTAVLLNGQPVFNFLSKRSA